LKPKKKTHADSISKAELLDALKKAHEQIQHLESHIAEYKWLEGALRRRTCELSERVKELDCLYAISSRLANPTGSLQKILADIVDIMPRGWQYPGATCVRLVLNGCEYRTSNFCKTKLKQTAFIRKGNKRIGVLEVYLLPSPVHNQYQPFLPQEKQLLGVIAIWIGVIIEYRK
jgi:nitrate/nitrite-specific signal transduction histidine kinase